MFEIWNEPNIALFWQPKPDPSAYTADLVAAYSAIKAVDPSAFVISGGLAPTVTKNHNISAIDFLKAMYADGAKGSFDAFGYHPYSFPELPDSNESGWSQMARTSPSLRSVMIRNGDGNKPIWVTEFGAPSGGPAGWGNRRRPPRSRKPWLMSKPHPGSVPSTFTPGRITGSTRTMTRTGSDC